LHADLENLRRAEIEAVRRYFKSGMRILDLGGGSGYQASLIASYGCEVLSIDLPHRPVPPRVFYPVQDYDGRNVPATDASFDIVFSSNVLEHIRTLEHTLGEIRRVLKPGGLAIHVLPTASWRFWMSISYFAYLLKRVGSRRTRQSAVSDEANVQDAVRRPVTIGFLAKVLLDLVLPHGEYPNAVAELYYFSKYRWLRVFRSNGYDVLRAFNNNLYYTGYGLFPSMSLEVRSSIARVLGSACHIFVMRSFPTRTTPTTQQSRHHSP
jgi:SAM-dependent methyltransferase